MFARHHYLNTEHNKASKAFVMTVENQLCGFVSALAFPHPVLKNAWREHRLVILPDFQGIGLGHYLSTWLGDYFKNIEKTLISTTTNPALIQSRKKDKRWKAQRLGRVNLLHTAKKFKSNSVGRLTASFKFIG